MYDAVPKNEPENEPENEPVPAKLVPSKINLSTPPNVLLLLYCICVLLPPGVPAPPPPPPFKAYEAVIAYDELITLLEPNGPNTFDAVTKDDVKALVVQLDVPINVPVNEPLNEPVLLKN